MRNYNDMSLFELMRALSWATDKNLKVDVKAIADVAKMKIDKCDAQQLSIGLSEKRIDGFMPGSTGLYFLMHALSWATTENSVEKVEAIANVAERVIEKCDAQQLSAGPSEKNLVVVTVLHGLMQGLSVAASGNSVANVKAVADIAKTVIEKCDVQKLSIGLSEKRTDGFMAGSTGLYFLMRALSWATTENSVENVEAIANVAKRVIEKCDAQQLSVGLSEKRTRGMFAGETGLDCLLRALNHAADKHSQENIKIIADLIIRVSAQLDSKQISDEQKKLIFSGKKNLSKTLKEYLANKAQTMPIEEFEKMCSDQTLLGALIDHHSSIFGGKGKTATRIFSDELYKKNSKVIAQTILEKFLRKEIALPDADSLTTIVEKEVKNRLGSEKSKDENVIHELALAVLSTDIIQKQLLPKREEFFKNKIAQTILEKFLRKEIVLPDENSLIAIVQEEAKKQLDPEKSKDQNAVDQLSLAVLKTDIIQKQLLPKRAKHEEKAGQSAASSQGPGLFAGPSADKSIRTVAAVEADANIVSRKDPAIHVPLSDDALQIDQLLSTLKVPKGKVTPPDLETDIEKEVRKKPKPLSS